MSKGLNDADNTLPVPTEDVEQMRIMQWARMRSGRYPELKLLFHIPNGGSRGKVEAARLKEMGVKPGVPDLFLPVPKGGYCGLFIELKRRRGGQVSSEQKEWIAALLNAGYCASVCRGFDAAADLISKYVAGEVKRWG